MGFVLDELIDLEIFTNSPMVREGDGRIVPLYVYYKNLMDLLERNKDVPKYKEHLDQLITDTIAVDSPVNLRVYRYCKEHGLKVAEFREYPIEERAEMLALSALNSMQDIVDRSHNIMQKNRNKSTK